MHLWEGNLGSVGAEHYDLFLSAYNASERVNSTYAAVSAVRKVWLIHPQYGFMDAELPSTGDTVLRSEDSDEAATWMRWLTKLPRDPTMRLCIDITGMMRPHLMLLPKLLAMRGYERASFLYSDPTAYVEGSKTRFAQGAVTAVRQVQGLEGVHRPTQGAQDLLVVGCGYDHELIRRVAEDKPAARKVQMFGLPSLQPHMYQEGQLRTSRAAESLSPLSDERSLCFAPAHNPLATAQVLQEAFERERDASGVENLYLSPLATKPQALGFALYYLMEQDGQAASMLFPIAPRYSRETSTGLARITVVDLELDWLPCFRSR